MWREILNNFAKYNKYIILNPPAITKDIFQVENALGVKLPQELKEFLFEVNGDNCFLFSTNKIIEINMLMRELNFLRNKMLIVATNGCGDDFGYLIENNEINDNCIYFWEHELNEFIRKADNLKDAIEKYYTDKI